MIELGKRGVLILVTIKTSVPSIHKMHAYMHSHRGKLLCSEESSGATFVARTVMVMFPAIYSGFCSIPKIFENSLESDPSPFLVCAY
jgi:hypothetical protein